MRFLCKRILIEDVDEDGALGYYRLFGMYAIKIGVCVIIRQRRFSAVFYFLQ